MPRSTLLKYTRQLQAHQVSPLPLPSPSPFPSPAFAGRHLITVSADGSVKVLRCPGLEVAHTFKMPFNHHALGVALSPDLASLSVAALDGSVYLFRLGTLLLSAEGSP